MKFSIRQELPEDYRKVSRLIEKVFLHVEISDHTEHLLVERLRNSNAFIPELSIVAEYEEEIIGHILLTKVMIKNKKETFHSLSMAPVSVKTEFQNRGIGTALIHEAHNKAKELGYNSVVLIGHKEYYPKFGYELSENYGITFPFKIPKENCMVIELVENGLKSVKGIVVYPKEFFS